MCIVSNRRKFEDTDLTREEYDRWTGIYADMKLARRERREAKRQKNYVAVPLGYRPMSPGLKRGPKPDPDRERTNQVLTCRVTDREAKELRRHHRLLCKGVSPSTFLRYVLCLWLEAHRDKHKDSQQFGFDPNSLDWRSKEWKSKRD